MPQLITMSDMITEIRELADMQNTNFVTDTEMLHKINDAYKMLYNELINKHEAYFSSESSIPLISGTNEYNVPSDFAKIVGVDCINSGKPYSLKPWSINERNRMQVGWNGRPLFYILKGNKILFRPDVHTTDTVLVYYIPAPTPITSTSQQVDFICGFDLTVKYKAALLCLGKEESDPSTLASLYTEAKQTLIESLERDDGLPKKMTDVNSMNDRYWYYAYGI